MQPAQCAVGNLASVGPGGVSAVKSNNAQRCASYAR